MPLAEVRDLLGHSSVTMTEKYAHLAPENVRAAITVLDGSTSRFLSRWPPRHGSRWEKLIRTYPVIKPPAKSTVHAVLDRHGLVKRRKRRRYKAKGTERREAQAPNALWCADYKGEFRLGNRKYCYPLTVTDYCSRYLLACEGLESSEATGAVPVFERVFKEFGLPATIRTITGCRSPPLMPYLAFLVCRCGGYASASVSNALSQDTHSKMGATSACI